MSFFIKQKRQHKIANKQNENVLHLILSLKCLFVTFKLMRDIIDPAILKSSKSHLKNHTSSVDSVLYDNIINIIYLIFLHKNFKNKLIL